jgi:DNA-binding transcriptional ArsR family regulator
MSPTATELLSAVNHPLRRRILFAYLDGGVACASARGLAEAMELPVEQIAYHLKALAQSDIMRPAQGEGRGAGEDRYGWTLGVEAEWLRLALEVWAGSDVSG